MADWVPPKMDSFVEGCESVKIGMQETAQEGSNFGLPAAEHDADSKEPERNSAPNTIKICDLPPPSGLTLNPEFD